VLCALRQRGLEICLAEASRDVPLSPVWTAAGKSAVACAVTVWSEGRYVYLLKTPAAYLFVPRCQALFLLWIPGFARARTIEGSTTSFTFPVTFRAPVGFWPRSENCRRPHAMSSVPVAGPRRAGVPLLGPGPGGKRAASALPRPARALRGASARGDTLRPGERTCRRALFLSRRGDCSITVRRWRDWARPLRTFS